MTQPDPTAEGRVLSTGHFKLDRSRAMDKLAHFQLSDRRSFVAELVAAAVCAGATSIEVRNDADDFEVEWDGAHPMLDDLDGFFDAIFYRGHDPSLRMVQHLAQGVLGAVGLDPRWVRLHRPGLTLDLTDPREPRSVQNDRTAGVRVEVRRRFSLDVLRKWGRKAFTELPEVAWLRELAAGCPVPVEVNGTPLPLPVHARVGPPAPGAAAITDPQGRFEGMLWRTTGADVPFCVLRDGIVAEATRRTVGVVRFAGWVRCDALELDASRSRVAQDALWADVDAALHEAMRAALAESLRADGLDQGGRHAARELLRGPTDPLAGLPLFPGLDGTAWYSLHDLARAPEVLITQHLDLHDPTHDSLQIVGDTALVHRLDQWLPDRVRLGTTELRRRKAGRERREVLQASALPLRVAALHSTLTPQTLPTATEARFSVGVGLAGAAWTGCRVELRVEGLTVEQVDLPGPGPVLVRVESDDLRARTDWKRVQPKALRSGLLEAIPSLVDAAVVEAARAHPDSPPVRAVVRSWMDATAGSKRPSVERLPAEMRELPYFSTGSGPLVSIADVVAIARETGRLDARKRPIVWTVDADEPAPRPEDRTLHVSADEAALLRQLFRGRVRSVGRELADRREAQARRDRARAAGAVPVLDVLPGRRPPHAAPVTLDRGRLRGEVGLALRGDAHTPCVVMREHVVLGTVDLPVDLPGACAVVEWDTAEPSRDWSGLADPDATALALSELLEPCFVALAREVATASPPSRHRRPGWWVALLKRGPSAAQELATVPFIETADGRVHTLADLLRHRARGRKAGRVRWVAPGTEVPPEVADRYFIADKDQVRILEAWLGAKGVVRGRDAVRDLRRQRERFYRSPVRPFSVSPTTVAAVTVSDAGLTLSFGLDGDARARDGVVIDVRHADRDLERIHRRANLPFSGVARGPRVKPQPAHNALAGPQITRDIFDRFQAERSRVIERLVANPTGDDRHRRLRGRVWLALHRDRLGWLDTAERERFRAAIEARPLLIDTAGGQRTAAELRDAHARGALFTLRDAPGAVAVPAGELWVVVRSRTTDLLRALVGGTPPSADRRVADLRVGAERYAALRPEPLEPSGTYPLARTTRLPSGGRAWLGLVPGRPGARVLRVDRRPVAEEAVPAAWGVRMVVEHPEVGATAAFDGWEDTELAHRTRVESVDALGTLLDDGLAVSPRLGGHAPAVLDVALRFRATGGHLSFDGPVLPVSHGPPRSLSELAAIARAGAIRFAPTGTVGRPLDPHQPVFVGDDARRAALETWGEVVDASEALAREAAAWDRRTAPRIDVVAPAGALFEVAVPPPVTGRLWAMPTTRARVVTLLDGRPLETRDATGPVPVAGFLSHPDLEADPWHRQARPDAVRARIAGAAHQAAESALATLLGSPEPPRELLLRTMLRVFDKRGSVRKASGTRGRLADWPAFEQSGPTPASLRQLVARRRSVRWVAGVGRYHSLDPDRPFITIPAELLDGFVQLVGGEDATDRARREHAAALRLQSTAVPFGLPSGTWLQTAEGQHRGHRWHVGLAEDFSQPGRVLLRLRGAPVGEHTHRRVGATFVLELDPGSTDATAPPKHTPKALQKALHTAYTELVRSAGPAVVDGHHRLRRFCGLLGEVRSTLRKGGLPPRSHALRPWLDVPVLPSPDGPRSIATLHTARRKGGTLLWTDGPQDVPADAILVLDTPTARTLTDALGWSARMTTHARWCHERDRADRAERAAQAKRAQEDRLARVRARLEPELKALAPPRSGDVDPVRAALSAVGPAHPDTDGSLVATVLAAWALLDPIVLRHHGPAGLVDLAQRAARRLADRTSARGGARR